MLRLRVSSLEEYNGNMLNEFNNAIDVDICILNKKIYTSYEESYIKKNYTFIFNIPLIYRTLYTQQYVKLYNIYNIH